MPNAMSLAHFIGHLMQFQHNMVHVATHSFDQIAQMVEREAKEELGTYQGAAPPFVGWAELADSTKDDRVRKGYPENEPGLRSGNMRDSIHHASDNTGAVVGSDDDKLVWFELGTVKQQPRSVLGTAVVHKEQDIINVLGGNFVSALMGQGVVGGALKIR